MQDGSERPQNEGDARPQDSGTPTRPQQPGEAETTRFGMEEGDNTDVPATGGPAADKPE